MKVEEIVRGEAYASLGGNVRTVEEILDPQGSKHPKVMRVRFQVLKGLRRSAEMSLAEFARWAYRKAQPGEGD